MQFKNIILSFVASAVVISAAAIPNLPNVPNPALPTPALPTPAIPTPALPTPAAPTPAAPTPATPDTQDLSKVDPQVCIDQVNSWLKGNAPASDHDTKGTSSCAICRVYAMATCQSTPVDFRLVCATESSSWCLYILGVGPPAPKPTVSTTPALPAPPAPVV